MTKKVVITGIGVASPIGNTLDSFWSSLSSQNAGDFKPINNVLELKSGKHFGWGTTVVPFDLSNYVPKMAIRRLSKVVQMSIYAARQAIEDAKMPLDELAETGVIFGTGFGGLSNTYNFFQDLVANGPNAAEPFFFPHTVPNAAASEVAINIKAKGPNTTFSTGCNSAESALLYAYDSIQLGYGERFIVGGVDDLSDMLKIGYCLFNALSPGELSPLVQIPYDVRRSGLALGEGCGVIIVESLESAAKRNAKIYAEIRGIGVSGGGVDLWSYSACQDAAEAISKALADSHFGVAEIDYIQSCANSTLMLDKVEALALHKVFGEQSPPISTIKPYVGEFMGMGILRIVALMLSMQNNVVPPILNTKMVDEECSINLILEEPLYLSIKTALYTNFAPGGLNICFIFNQFGMD